MKIEVKHNWSNTANTHTDIMYNALYANECLRSDNLIAIKMHNVTPQKNNVANANESNPLLSKKIPAIIAIP